MYDCTCMTFWKEQNYEDSKKMSGFWGGEKRDGEKRWSTEDFRAVKLL